MPALIRIGFIVGLWLLAFVLMVASTILRHHPGAIPLTGWALLSALVAAVITICHVLLHERQHCIAIAEAAAASALEHRDGLHSC